MGAALYLKFRGFVADYPLRYPQAPEGYAGLHAVVEGARRTIGRTGEANMVLAHDTVSRIHAVVDATVFPATLEDLGSTSGTRLNGRNIKSPTSLSPGDEIGIGQVLLLVHEMAPRSEPRSLDAWAIDLHAQERDRRWAAAEALGSLADKGRGALAALLRALDDDHPPVRRYAARALGLIGHDAAVPSLTQHLGEPDELVAVEIARALGRFEERAAGAAPALVEALSRKTVQHAASQALGRLGPAAVPALKTTLEGDDTSALRLAAQALADLGDQARPAVPVLVRLARHEDPDVRRDVLRALSKIGAGAAVAASTLFDVLERDDDGRVRAWAASALGGAARGTRWEARAVAELTRALEDPELRFSAIVALGRLGPAARVAVPSLERIARDERELYARAAGDALASIDG